MGYKLRKVPPNWEHPKDNNGNFIPLFEGSYSEYSKWFDERKSMWEKGFKEDAKLLNNTWKYEWVAKKDNETTYTFEEWDGEKHLESNYRPDWKPEEMTHFQMYENVTEGTPVSPIFATTDELAEWLALNLDDKLYPYTSIKWKRILKSSHPQTMFITTVPK